MTWLIDYDRALGTSHAGGSQPCQDSISYLSTKNKNWHSICLSDGAGSAKHSEVSSEYVSENFCRSLIELANEIDVKGPGSWINDQIISDVLALRLGLKEHTASHELDDYHCTLVAFLVGKKVSIAVQIGDGGIVAGKSSAISKDFSSINDQIYVSLPENGEYKNETYFITESHWLKHLRIKVFGEIDWFVMGSDGGMDVLSDREKLNGHLVAKLLNNMSNMVGQKSTVTELITSEFAVKKTNDDISCAFGLFGPNFYGGDMIWDDGLAPDVYLDPAARATLVLPVLGVTPQPSATEKLNLHNQSILSKFRFLGLHHKTILIAFLSMLAGSIFSYLFFQQIQKVEPQLEQPELKVEPQLEQPELEVKPKLEQPELKVEPKLEQPQQKVENDDGLLQRMTNKLRGWWEHLLGLNTQNVPESNPLETQVPDPKDI
jgi:serine/threonine protein phosphatase PrpC